MLIANILFIFFVLLFGGLLVIVLTHRSSKKDKITLYYLFFIEYRDVYKEDEPGLFKVYIIVCYLLGFILVALGVGILLLSLSI